MRSIVLRSAALLLALAGCGSGETTATAVAQPAQIAVVSSVERDVSAWLDRAGPAPHNGVNPQIELPPTLVRDGATFFQHAITSGAEQRRRDAASALARHPEPATQRTFWLAHLSSSDAAVRLFALTSVAEVHAPEDFEPFVRACLTTGDTNTLAVRARDWADPRAVPIMAELLLSGDLIAANAAISLSQLPRVPALAAEQVDPNATAVHLEGGAWRAPERSTIQPYTRWWTTEGRAAFTTECTWWRTLRPDSVACPAPAP